jgi:predicted P-loop ATPase
MVGAVARVMDPGCKHDHVPVVVSPRQGSPRRWCTTSCRPMAAINPTPRTSIQSR